jgi:hypothetical protein
LFLQVYLNNPSMAGERLSPPFDLDQAYCASMRQDAMPLDTTGRLALVRSFAWLVVLALGGLYLILHG